MTTTIDPGMGATTRTSTSSPRPAQRSHELTSRRLYTFGAVILGLIVVLASVAIVGSRSQNSAAAEANEIAEMRSQLQTADMMHDAIRAVVFGSGLESQIGAEAVAELRTELDENIAVFADSIATAQSVPTSNEQITQLLEETAAKVDVYGQTSIDLFGHLADVSSPDADVAADASSRFDAWTAAFEDLKTSMETTTEVIGVEGERIVDASSTTSSRSIVTVLIALLVAIGLFVFVWRRVLVSVGQTNRLKAESDRISAMVENSPTNTMYCGTDLTIQYMNPASFRTMRSIERLLPCKVDEIVGKSIDIFHTTPERARKMLADPERFLPHTAQIHVGDEIMELNVCAIRDADGTYIGAMATWSLVTDKVRVEREAAELHERERVAAAELAAKVARTRRDPRERRRRRPDRAGDRHGRRRDRPHGPGRREAARRPARFDPLDRREQRGARRRRRGAAGRVVADGFELGRDVAPGELRLRRIGRGVAQRRDRVGRRRSRCRRRSRRSPATPPRRRRWPTPGGARRRR
jgi:hypothetical protein